MFEKKGPIMSKWSKFDIKMYPLRRTHSQNKTLSYGNTPQYRPLPTEIDQKMWPLLATRPQGGLHVFCTQKGFIVLFSLSLCGNIDSNFTVCRYVQFRTLRDASDRLMTSTLTIMTPMESIHRILVDGKPPTATWQRVGGENSGLSMAMTMMSISDGAHYIATAELESAFTAWLMLRRSGHTSSISLGNAGRLRHPI